MVITQDLLREFKIKNLILISSIDEINTFVKKGERVDDNPKCLISEKKRKIHLD
jgi:hypothetical protein